MDAGIPVDPHPKFPDKSALEVIMCTLHAGGKFSGEAYQVSGGLHGVGVSVVNALSSHVRVEVAREQKIYCQEFSRGVPVTDLRELGKTHNRRGTTVTFNPDPEIFGDSRFRPRQVFEMAKSKAFLFSGLDVRWNCDAALIDGTSDVPTTAHFFFPGGIKDYLGERLAGLDTNAPGPFAGKVKFHEKFGNGTNGSVEWAINWTHDRSAFLHSFCNTVPTAGGGTHEQGFWSAILKGTKAYGKRTGNRKASLINREDIVGSGCAILSCFVREPEFSGQTKDRLVSADVARLVEKSISDHFDNWLASDTQAAIPSWICLRSVQRIVCAGKPKRKRRGNHRHESSAFPENSSTAARQTRPGLNCSSWKGTARAAPPRWLGTGRPRPCSRYGERS